jgi:hypothetical protein
MSETDAKEKFERLLGQSTGFLYLGNPKGVDKLQFFFPTSKVPLVTLHSLKQNKTVITDPFYE